MCVSLTRQEHVSAGAACPTGLRPCAHPRVGRRTHLEPRDRGGGDRNRPRSPGPGLVATGYQVYALNPFAVSRYRDRHTVSRAKSDPGDAKVLADLVRTDRQNHRPLAGDSELRKV